MGLERNPATWFGGEPIVRTGQAVGPTARTAGAIETGTTGMAGATGHVWSAHGAEGVAGGKSLTSWH